MLVLYGEGLGGIALVERKADIGGSGSSRASDVSLDGLTAHELATQLGTGSSGRRAERLRARGLAAGRGRRGGGPGGEVSDAPPVEARGLVKRYGESSRSTMST